MKKILIFSGASVALIVFITTSNIVDFSKFGGVEALLIFSQKNEVYAECISQISEEENKFKLTQVIINSDFKDDAILQYTKEPQCGNAGCVYELCISNADGTYTHTPFGYAGHSIAVKNTITEGMHDLMLNNDKNASMVWDGSTYVLNSSYSSLK